MADRSFPLTKKTACCLELKQVALRSVEKPTDYIHFTHLATRWQLFPQKHCTPISKTRWVYEVSGFPRCWAERWNTHCAEPLTPERILALHAERLPVP